jgi:hypothetical protein
MGSHRPNPDGEILADWYRPEREDELGHVWSVRLLAQLDISRHATQHAWSDVITLTNAGYVFVASFTGSRLNSSVNWRRSI